MCFSARHLGGTGKRTEPGAWECIQLTSTIAELAKKQSVDAMMLMTGDSYDCGKKWAMQAFVEVRAAQPEEKGEVP